MGVDHGREGRVGDVQQPGPYHTPLSADVGAVEAANAPSRFFRKGK